MIAMTRSAFALALLAGAAAMPLPASAGEAVASAPLDQALPAIRVVSAERREIVETVSVNGTIVAREEAAVGTDLNGLIVEALNADQGDRVRKGDVLARLDRSMLDTQLAQMRATRAQAEASAAQMNAEIADTRVGVKQAG
jgi:HlyD family secretion protein